MRRQLAWGAALALWIGFIVGLGMTAGVARPAHTPPCPPYGVDWPCH